MYGTLLEEEEEEEEEEEQLWLWLWKTLIGAIPMVTMAQSSAKKLREEKEEGKKTV